MNADAVKRRVSILTVFLLWTVPITSVILFKINSSADMFPDDKCIHPLPFVIKIYYVLWAIFSNSTFFQVIIKTRITTALLIATVLVLMVLFSIEIQQNKTVINVIVSEPRAVYNNLIVEILRNENLAHVEDSSDRKIMTIIKVMALVFVISSIPFLHIMHSFIQHEKFVHEKMYDHLSLFMNCINRFINPLICVVLHKEFRVLFKTQIYEMMWINLKFLRSINSFPSDFCCINTTGVWFWSKLKWVRSFNKFTRYVFFVNF